MIYAIWNEGNKVVLLKESTGRLLQMGSARAFMESWCLEFGSTFQGRQIAARHLLNVTQKVPILISDHTMDIVFPTRSASDLDCVWLNYRGIVAYRHEKKGTLFDFRDGQTYFIEEDIRIFHREMKLCEMYFEHFKTR